jgi:hypothetical protein
MATRYWRTKLAATIGAGGLLIGSVALMAAEGVPAAAQPGSANGATTGGGDIAVTTREGASQPTRSDERQSRAS